MEKIMKTSKILNNIAGFYRTLLKVATIIIAVAVVILLFVSKHSSIWSGVDYTLQLGDVSLALIPDGTIPPDATRLLTIGGLIFSIPLLIFSSMCLRIIQDILYPMSQGKPFTDRVSNSLRKLSFITLIVGAISEIGDMVFSTLELSSIKLDALFNPAVVSGYTVEHSMDMNFLLLFGVLFLMSHVFRYGEQLQQLSDETL